MKIQGIFKNQSVGAILIEFAFSFPILLAILYFILDGPGLRLYQLKLKNSAYLAVNLIQNLTDQRNNKSISGNDLKKITLAAFGNIYTSKLMLKDSETSEYPLGHYGHIYLWCVYGNEDGTASVKWVWASGAPGINPTGFSSRLFTSSSFDLNNSIVKFGESVEPVSIHPSLVIKPRETKMILEVSLIVHSDIINSSVGTNEEENNEENGDNNEEEEGKIEGTNAAEIISASKEVRASGAGKLGFFLIPLKPMAQTLNSYLNYIVIFRPKSGLFNVAAGPN